MKTTSQLIESVKQEYSERLLRGESSFDHPTPAAFYYIDKYFDVAQRQQFAKDAVAHSLAQFTAIINQLVAEYKGMPYRAWHKISDQIQPYQNLIDFCLEDLAGSISEEELIQLLAYYEKPQIMYFYHGEYFSEQNPDNLQERFLSVFTIQKLLASYKAKNGFSPTIHAEILKLKENLIHVSSANHLDELLDEAQAFIPQAVKTLDAKELATGKKWKWLQEYDFTFIKDPAQFYDLVAQLSKRNYFNVHTVDEALASTIASIDPKEYEVFMLDIYEETNQAGAKRSAWFTGEKVIAFQAFTWLMHHIETPNRYHILAKLANKCFTKIPRVGPISRKLGDVVLKLLDESETIEGLGTLINLKSKAKYPVFKKALEVSIEKAIWFTQLKPDEIEDYFIDDYGLQDGVVRHQFDEFRSEIQIESFQQAALVWFKKDGKTQKTVPAHVKKNFPSELKLWKAKHKDIKKELSTQKHRLEGFWVKGKSWKFDKWSTHLLHHPLLCFLTQKLIWQIGSNSVFWQNGQLITASEETITPDINAQVSLWHPCQATVEEVIAWREYLLDREIKQPFKQAFREIYLVTDAEINTATYSNRYLNHIVKHHMFAALAQQRSWEYPSVYAQHDPFVSYQHFNVQATLEVAADYDFAQIGRLHFRDTSTNQALHVSEVPTILFSEIMRDADLFVGVCSIGLEEEWHQTTHANYWTSYANSPLSEIAKTRKTVLQRIIPRLKIKDFCEFTEKYLKVTGKIRTYKIHLGTGNILMDDTNQYLCIVPDLKKRTNVFLPFDDDKILSIVLSKALLLADDDKITDTSITSQIHRST